jgi:hypothetical protein
MSFETLAIKFHVACKNAATTMRAKAKNTIRYDLPTDASFARSDFVRPSLRNVVLRVPVGSEG